MNTKILHIEIQDFINSNLKSDITKLILKGSSFEAVSIQEIAAQIEAKNKCEKKLPTWFSLKNIYFPKKLNIEQTSSEITAKYKANLVFGNTLIDLTGGFGVDSYYFSKKVKNITHCEIDKELSGIVTYNLGILNSKNISTYVGDGFEYLEKNNTKFDWIYADPSRRNDAKGKVFLLEDCLPNIPKNLEFLFKYTGNILLKISPILDIKSAIHELKFVKEVHVVAVENEVKELLLVLEKNYIQQIDYKTINITKKSIQTFNFNFNSIALANYSKPKKYIYEPNVAILKSGAFQQISTHYKLDKLHQHSHLYTSNNLIDFPGRTFKIKQISSYNKKELTKFIPLKKANITTRNFPETVAQIRKKINFKDGGNLYLFFTTNLNNRHIVLICEKV
ncbi:MAG: class I SAM-dependent methyltransferase [Lutibacter sp.]|uniref:THUMP-like domain-containing protein n=1 Tax=Lutibacter sp. TaxID=1925666 RepID=UPI00385819A5